MRRAAYPDLQKFEAERDGIEAAWPHYRGEKELCRPPRFAFTSSEALSEIQASEIQALETAENAVNDVAMWKRAYLDWFQYIASRKNHHIHPKKSAPKVSAYTPPKGHKN